MRWVKATILSWLDPFAGVLHGRLPAVVGMAGAAKILSIVKTQRVAAMICNPDFSADDVIDFSRSSQAFTEDGNLTQRLIEEHNWNRVLAPVLRVIGLLESERATIGVALP